MSEFLTQALQLHTKYSGSILSETGCLISDKIYLPKKTLQDIEEENRDVTDRVHQLNRDFKFLQFSKDRVFKYITQFTRILLETLDNDNV